MPKYSAYENFSCLCTRTLFLTLLVFSTIALHAAEKASETKSSWPAEKEITYKDTDGVEHVYLVQEPKSLPADPKILIYMHGAAGLEEQGMDPVWAARTFSRIRALMAKWGWIYICPRDNDDHDGLVAHLRKAYNPSEIYLSGASAGGRAAFKAARKRPKDFAGVLLMCPAVRYPKKRRVNVSMLNMPLWIISGDKDVRITAFCRELVKDLKAAKKVYRYIEIPGGNHGAPLEQADWKAALEFLRMGNEKTAPEKP